MSPRTVEVLRQCMPSNSTLLRDLMAPPVGTCCLDAAYRLWLSEAIVAANHAYVFAEEALAGAHNAYYKRVAACVYPRSAQRVALQDARLNYRIAEQVLQRLLLIQIETTQRSDR